MMEQLNELYYRCIYILAVAKAPLPSQLKYELIFGEDVAEYIDQRVSLGTIYGMCDSDWEGHEKEVQEYAVVIEKLLADLEKIEV
jgi:hypothetical protein